MDADRMGAAMNFLITYITVSGGERTERYAQRFTSSWHNNPPGSDNWGLVVVANGGPPSATVSRHFDSFGASWLPRDNSGHDIAAYIDVAGKAECYDFLLCLGQSVYFHRAGWLKRLTEVCQKYGPGMYGFYSSNIVSKHLNTTAFAVSPELLRGWAQVVDTKQKRYDFEHHPTHSFWRQVEALGRPVKLVMWDHCLDPWQWRTTENEFWRGDQSQCLMWCSHTDRFANAVKATRTRWTNNADRGLPVAA